MAYRCRPQNDVHVLEHKDQGHGPRSLIEPEDAAVLIDATLKEAFPPVSLPKKEFMENAAQIWDELGLPTLRPESPWFGYSLGEWGEDLEEMAGRAVKSEYWETGKIYAQRRRSDVAMNTEVRTVAEEPEGGVD